METPVANSSPLVSVVIPTHNRADVLEESIVSILGQNFDDYEVVFVNDSSTDSTAEILSKYSDRVQIVEVKCGAPGPTRNRGVGKARGRYILFIDDDCTVPADWISGMLAAHHRGGCDVTAGGVQSHGFSNAIETYLYFRHRIIFGDHPKRVKSVTMMSVLIERSLFLQLGGFVEESLRACEDWEFSARLRAQGGEIYYDPSVSVIHRFQTTYKPALQRLLTSARVGIQIAPRLGYGRLRYLLRSWAVFAGCPIWIPRYFPPGLYVLATYLEFRIILARTAAYFAMLLKRPEEKET